MEIAGLCSAAMLLTVAAVFIGQGGMTKVNHLLAVAHILPESQTACVFPCNNGAYDMEALTPMQGGVAVSTVQPGTTVYWQYIASTYGANTFNLECAGSQSGLSNACSVALGAGNVWGSCTNPYYTGGTTCLSWTYTYDKFGNMTASCNQYDTPVYHPAANCGNADAYIQGDTCYGASGGIYPNYSCPGYHGNPYGTMPITAPSTPGTYTYYFCSYYLLHANSYNRNLTPLSCLGTNLTVAAPPTPTTLTSLTASPATVTAGTASTLSWQGVKGTNFSSCELADDYSHAWWYSALPGSDSSGPMTAGAHNFYMQCYDTTGAATGWQRTTVTAVPPASCSNGLNASYSPSCTCPASQVQSGSSCTTPSDICTDIPGNQTSVPSSCTGPVPAPVGSCIPGGDSWSGSACVPTCSNGLNASYSPSCTCPASQVQSGSSCTTPSDICTDIPGNQTSVPSSCTGPVPAPVGSCIPGGDSWSGSACVPTCSNGLNASYSPSCTCPAHQYQPLGASTCVALPICANGLSEAYSPSCTCPSGQVQVAGGSTCVLQGVINSFTANPSRVLKGNTAAISWSTSNMSSCTLSSLVSTGTSNLSSLLSSSITPTVNSKTIFTLTCTDASGASYSASATVNLIPQTIEQ